MHVTLESKWKLIDVKGSIIDCVSVYQMSQKDCQAKDVYSKAQHFDECFSFVIISYQFNETLIYANKFCAAQFIVELT